MNEAVLAGQAVEDWQIASLQTHWTICYGFIEEHHHNEEEHIFPVIHAKVRPHNHRIMLRPHSPRTHLHIL